MSWADQLRQEGLQQGLQKGRQEGRQESLREILLNLLTAKFGGVSDAVRKQVEASDSDTLTSAIERVLSASTAEDVFGA